MGTKCRSLISGSNESYAQPSGMVSLSENLSKSLSYDVSSGGGPIDNWQVWSPSHTDASNPYCIRVSGDGKYVFTSSNADYISRHTMSRPYDLSTATFDNTINMASLYLESASYAFDLSPDGKYLYYHGADRDSIALFNMTTPWDLSTLTYGATPYKKWDGVRGATGSTQSVYAFTYGDSGNKIYFSGLVNDTIAQYSLSSAYDVSTISETYSTYTLSASPNNRAIRSIRWKPDGSKFWILEYAQDSIYEFSVSVNWDISSTVTEGNSLSILSYENNPWDFAWNDDGTEFIVVGSTGDVFDRFSLSVAYDISSTLTHNGTTATNDTYPTGCDFNSDGTLIAWCGEGTGAIYIGELSTAYDVTSMGNNYTVYDMNHICHSYNTSSYYIQEIWKVRWASLNSTDDALCVLDGYDDVTTSNYDRIFLIPFVGKDSNFSGLERNGLLTGSLYVYDQSVNVQGTRISPDGTKIFMINGTTMWQYSLDIPYIGLNYPYGFGGLAYDGTSIALNTDALVLGTSFQDFSFSPDGLYIYTVDLNQDRLYVYTTSVPFVIESSAATITFINSFSIVRFDSAPRSVHIAGNNIYICGTSIDDVWYAPIPF